MFYRKLLTTASVTAVLSLGVTAPVSAQTILTTGNGIVRNSLCVGGDCQSGISFSDSTLILKENNTRLKFSDTSSTGSFPRNDWELEANSQSNGGPNRFSIFDCGQSSNDGGCGSPTANVFSVEAGAGPNALYVDDGGRVGLGTSTPSVELHVVDGDTPTLRLEQNTSSGFDAQTWDVAGNETNFFIRDVTGGSSLPFRIRPGAPSSAIYIDTDGNVGLGTASPVLPLHIKTTGSDAAIALQNGTSAANFNLNWAADDTFRMSVAGTGQQEFLMDASGNVTITGGLVTGTVGSCTVGTPCDAVFDPAVYTVPSIEDHAASMWQNKYLPAVGPTGAGTPINVSERVLTMLNELEHAHIYIEQLNERVRYLETLIANKG